MEDEEINISFDNIINLIDESKYSEEIINSLEKKEIPSKEKIFSYILDNKANISLLGLLMLRSQFDKIFRRNYLTEFFTSKQKHKSNSEDVSMWVEEYIDYKEDKIIKKAKVELNTDDIFNLIYIIEKIYSLLATDVNKSYAKLNRKKIKELKEKIEELEKEKQKGNNKEKEEKKEKKSEEKNEEESEEKSEEEKEKEEEENEEESEENTELDLRRFLIEIILNIFDLEEKLI